LLRKTTPKSLTVNSLGAKEREMRQKGRNHRNRNQFRTTDQNACVFLELGQQVRAEKYQSQTSAIKETIAGVLWL